MYKPRYQPADGNIERLKILTKELYESEQKLGQAKELIDALFNSSLSILIVVCDRNGILTRVSPSVKKLLGWDYTEVVGKHYTEMVSLGDSTDVAVNKFREMTEEDKDADGTIVSWKCKDGSCKNIKWFAPSFNTTRNYICSIGLVEGV